MKLGVSKRFLGWLAANILFLFVLIDVILAKKSFYEVALALSSSKLATVLFYAFWIANTWGTFIAVRWFFFGKLTATELTATYDNFYVKCIEVILNLTIFEQIDSKGVLWTFAVFLGLKVLHECAAARLSSIEGSAVMNKRATVRLTWVLWIFFAVDVFAAVHYFQHYQVHGVDVHMTLLLDAALMALSCFELTAKVYLFVADDGSDGKGILRFYLTFAVRMTQCLFLVSFSCIAISVASMPIYVLRQLFMGLRNMSVTLSNFTKYQRLALKIDKKFPQPLPEDLADDAQCVICYDSISTVETAKKLPCGHIYHRGCLRRWFEKKSSCPYCRKELDDATVAMPQSPLQRPAAAPAAAAAAPATPVRAAVPPGQPGQTPLLRPLNNDGPAAPLSPPTATTAADNNRALYEEYLARHRETGESVESFLRSRAVPTAAPSAQGQLDSDEDESLARLLEREEEAYNRLVEARDEYSAVRRKLMLRLLSQTAAR